MVEVVDLLGFGGYVCLEWFVKIFLHPDTFGTKIGTNDLYLDG
jgi:hypothetical protein